MVPSYGRILVCRSPKTSAINQKRLQMANVEQEALSDLYSLVRLFYEQADQLARFEPVTSAETPAPYRSLLDHGGHMTVTLESHHRCPVDVHALRYRSGADIYARTSLLTRQSDGAVVQFGIIRLHTRYLSAPVRREIEGRQIPLGRVLIQHNVLRKVELEEIWRVTPGLDLARLFGLDEPVVTYGRTAIIHCNGEPAVELLEIVAPDSSASSN